MSLIKKEYQKFNKNYYNSFILGADIGGTNTTIGIFGIKNNYLALLLSFSLKTKKIKEMHQPVNEALSYIEKKYEINVTNACFGVAGVLSSERESAKITNGNLTVEKTALLKDTKLKKILIINDFEAIGYGINIFDKDDIIVIKEAQKISKAPIIIIGAGTGLGKTTLIYDEHYKFYIPLPSEAGHSDFTAQNQYELELINFVKKHKKVKQSISYEQVLSGQGLINIYLFIKNSRKFKETKYTKEIDKANNKPELISKYRNSDKICREVFKTFKIIYARFAKNFALDALAWGGVYIAGGIAPKNKDIFDSKFIRAFENSHKMKHVLKRIPIYLISGHHNPGLLGAGFAGAKFL